MPQAYAAARTHVLKTASKKSQIEFVKSDLGQEKEKAARKAASLTSIRF